MSKDNDSFWNYERKLYLIEAIRQDPSLWAIEPNPHPTIEQKFNDLGQQMGVNGADCIQMYQKLSAKYHINRKKLDDGKKSKVKWEFFEKMQFLDEAPKQVVGYVNDGFNSASSESEDGFPISSTVSSRKRPHSPRSPPKIFQRAAEYMVAELENMDRTKAEILLNKTLKFFVEHRYD